MERSELISILHSELRTNPWPPKPGQSIEILCLRSIALRRDNAPEREQRLLFLERLQGRDGAWPAVIGDEQQSAWTTALAALTLMSASRSSAPLQRAFRWLVQSKGREANWFWQWKFRNVDNEVKFDPAKYGWAWMPGTTSWVVPTGMSIIALQKGRPAGFAPAYVLNERIDIGVAMLLDRMCPGGGWNAGNGIAFGVALVPYIDATAIALLGLQRQKHEAVDASLLWLSTRLRDCPSPYSLAWGILALATYQKSGIELSAVLQQASTRLIAAIGNAGTGLDTGTLALCALALGAVEGENVFAVPS